MPLNEYQQNYKSFGMFFVHFFFRILRRLHPYVRVQAVSARIFFFFLHLCYWFGYFKVWHWFRRSLMYFREALSVLLTKAKVKKCIDSSTRSFPGVTGARSIRVDNTVQPLSLQSLDELENAGAGFLPLFRATVIGRQTESCRCANNGD